MAMTAKYKCNLIYSIDSSEIFFKNKPWCDREMYMFCVCCTLSRFSLVVETLLFQVILTSIRTRTFKFVDSAHFVPGVIHLTWCRSEHPSDNVDDTGVAFTGNIYQ